MIICDSATSQQTATTSTMYIHHVIIEPKGKKNTKWNIKIKKQFMFWYWRNNYLN